VLGITSITPMAQAILIVKLVLAVVSWAGMVIAGIRSRVLREQRLRELLPDTAGIMRPVRGL
jgi:hypothetical protein